MKKEALPTTQEEMIEQYQEQEKFLLLTARFYLEWQGVDQTKKTDSELMSLARTSLASDQFEQEIKSWISVKDPLEFHQWKTQYLELKNESANDPSRIFGLSIKNRHSLAWLTYQFVQYDALHLLSNVLTLLLFSALAESLIGGILTGVLYLLGGFVGGAAHLWLGGIDNTLPLVGSSAAVAALIGFVAMGTLRKRIAFITIIHIYGLLMRGHPQSRRWLEPLYLSPLWILSYFLLSDITAIISTPLEASSSVAHWAHVGGGLTGILLGVAFKVGVKRQLVSNSFFGGGKTSS